MVRKVEEEYSETLMLGFVAVACVFNPLDGFLLETYKNNKRYGTFVDIA